MRAAEVEGGGPASHAQALHLRARVLARHPGVLPGNLALLGGRVTRAQGHLGQGGGGQAVGRSWVALRLHRH